VTVNTGSGNGCLGLNYSDDADFTVDANNIPLGGTGAGVVTFTGPLYSIAKAAPTSVAVPTASGAYGGTVNLSATLTKTSDGSAVSGKTISFALNGTSAGTATTNASGVATLSSVSLSGINTNTYAGGFSASFAGDSNFLASSGSNSLTVNAATVSPNVTASNKSYDATTAATITTRSLTGVIGTDNVSLTGGSATFTDRNAGNSKTVTVTGLSLSGTAAGNYQLSSTTATTTANITALGITGSITADNKMYDGTTAATIASRSLTGVLGTDQVSLTISTGAFADIDVGNGKTVTATGLSVSGPDAGNYSLMSTAAWVTANITARPLTAWASVVIYVYVDKSAENETN